MFFRQAVTSLLRAAPASPMRMMSAAASPPASVWSLGKLNHVAIAVPNLEAATSLYRDMLGATVSPPEVRRNIILVFHFYTFIHTFRTCQNTV